MKERSRRWSDPTKSRCAEIKFILIFICLFLVPSKVSCCLSYFSVAVTKRIYKRKSLFSWQLQKGKIPLWWGGVMAKVTGVGAEVGKGSRKRMESWQACPQSRASSSTAMPSKTSRNNAAIWEQSIQILGAYGKHSHINHHSCLALNRLSWLSGRVLSISGIHVSWCMFKEEDSTTLCLSSNDRTGQAETINSRISQGSCFSQWVFTTSQSFAGPRSQVTAICVFGAWQVFLLVTVPPACPQPVSSSTDACNSFYSIPAA